MASWPVADVSSSFRGSRRVSDTSVVGFHPLHMAVVRRIRQWDLVYIKADRHETIPSPGESSPLIILSLQVLSRFWVA